MNAVVVAVTVMLILSLARVNVILAIFLGAVVGGLTGGLDVTTTLNEFTSGLGGGASTALSYALLGAFAMGISRSGLPEYLIAKLLKKIEHTPPAMTKTTILLSLLGMAIASQNILPIHIAFIPILLPPLLPILSALKMDRRMVCCVMTFGLTATYMSVPVGFGNIYLSNILGSSLTSNGLQVANSSLPWVMLIPVSGMFLGLLVAVFISYRKPREYVINKVDTTQVCPKLKKSVLFVVILAVFFALLMQLKYDSIMLGGLVGCLTLLVGGAIGWREADRIFIDGLKVMALCGFIMVAAAGFAQVLKATGDIQSLVSSVESFIHGSRAVAALLMLLIGLLITMGIGSSFSTVPILAALYVPFGLQLGFSPLAIASLVGTAGALGDAGSPASDSTLGPTAGLNVDGQHDHIRDSVLSTFIHYNIPLILFGWIAAMVL